MFVVHILLKQKIRLLLFHGHARLQFDEFKCVQLGEGEILSHSMHSYRFFDHTNRGDIAKLIRHCSCNINLYSGR